MTEGDRATAWVQLGRVGIEFQLPYQWYRSECLVDLIGIDSLTSRPTRSSALRVAGTTVVGISSGTSPGHREGVEADAWP